VRTRPLLEMSLSYGGVVFTGCISLSIHNQFLPLARSVAVYSSEEEILQFIEKPVLHFL